MGRPPRISFPGALFHITVRGNNKGEIFIDKKDYQKFLNILRKYKEEFSFHLYAYVLMSNHFHLLMQIGEKIGLSKIMQVLNTAYTKYFTSKYQRVGHVFQGRFHSVLVDKDEYLLVLTQYIHLNPVRANLVTQPEDYLWSSCNNYLRGRSGALIDVDEVLDLLGSNPEEQCKLYRELLKLEAVQKERQLYIRERLYNNRINILGSGEFVDKLIKTSGTK